MVDTKGNENQKYYINFWKVVWVPQLEFGIPLLEFGYPNWSLGTRTKVWHVPFPRSGRADPGHVLLLPAHGYLRNQQKLSPYVPQTQPLCPAALIFALSRSHMCGVWLPSYRSAAEPGPEGPKKTPTVSGGGFA